MFRLVWSLLVVSLVAADTLYFKPGQTKKGGLRSRTVVCPDHSSTCPEGQTCCQLATGQYGCCPLPKAVCCSDHEHCCPEAHTCDVAQSKCLDGAGQAKPWLLKKLAQSLKYVICPGGQYQCPNGNTCCKSRSGDWGCCPFPKAACCTDGNHCCPLGYKCDLGHGTCVKSGAASVLLGRVQEAPRMDASKSHSTRPTMQKLKKQPTQAANLKLKSKVAQSASEGRSQAAPAASISLSSAKVQQQKASTFSKTAPSQPPSKGKQAPSKAAPRTTPPLVKKTEPPKMLKSTMASKAASGKRVPKTVPKVQTPAKSQTTQGKKVAPLKNLQKRVQGVQAQAKKLPSKGLGQKLPAGRQQEKEARQVPVKSSPPSGRQKQQAAKTTPPSGVHKQPLKQTDGGTASTQQKTKSQEKDKEKEKDNKTSQQKKPRKIMDSITETIQATVTAIKETVHRVVGSGRKTEKPTTPSEGRGAKSEKKPVAKGKQDQSGKPLKQTPPAKPIKAKETQQLSKKVDAKSTLKLKVTEKGGQTGTQKPKVPLKKVPKTPQKVTPKVITKIPLKVQQKVAHKTPQKVPLKIVPKSQQKVLQKTVPKSPQKVPPKVVPKFQTKVVPKAKPNIPQKAVPKFQSKVPQKVVPTPAGKTQHKVVSKVPQLKIPGKVIPKSSPQIQKLVPKPKLQKAVPKTQQQKLPHKTPVQKVPSKVVPKATPPKVVKKSATQNKVNVQAGAKQVTQQKPTKQTVAKTKPAAVKAPKAVPQRQLTPKSGQQKPPPKATPKSTQQLKVKPIDSGQMKTHAKVPAKQHVSAAQQRASSQEKPKLQVPQNIQGKTLAQKQENLKLALLKQKQKQKQHAVSSGGQAKQHLGVGRRLLGLAWRLIGLETVQTDRTEDHVDVDEASDSVEAQEDINKSSDRVEAEDDINKSSDNIKSEEHLDKAYDGIVAQEEKNSVKYEVLEEGDLPVEVTIISQVNDLEEDSVEVPAEQTKDVMCPGGTSTCPDGTTCCQMQSGAYGCCPLPNAVCCSDHIHCCSEGQTCDVQKGSCNSGDKTTEWFHKIPALPTTSQGEADVKCPDGTACPSGSTCCKLEGSGYGCCPLPQAVCCADGEHCCPQGYSCDTGTGACTMSTSSVPWSVKYPAQPVGSTATSNICPDHQSMCPDDSTCCKMSSGVWGCCPMVHAVCCTDGEHCCPGGTTCDVQAGTCNAITSSLSISNTRLRMLSKMIDNNQLLKQDLQVITCGDGTECPDGNTCCEMTSGKYACCPHVKATCCKDKVHCCPTGFTCPPKGVSECQKGSISISWTFFARIPARVSSQKPVEDIVQTVVCPDTRVECPGGNTCCPMDHGGFGCCALPEAVCCKAGFCCPKGTKCDSKGKRCLRSVSWFSKTPSRKVRQEVVMCGDSTESCPPDHTCCRAVDGSWGCCVSP